MNQIKKIIKSILPKAQVFHWIDVRNKLLRNDQYKRRLEEIALRSEFNKQLIKPGEIGYDIGANLGNRIDGFLKAGATVVAVEPQVFCCDYLKLRFGGRLSLVNMAVGAQKGESDLFESDSHTLTSLSSEYIDTVSNTRFKHAKWKRAAKVQVTTLKDLVAIYGVPSFIKIDVEGYELEVLKGLDRPVNAISFEYNTPEMKDLLFQCVDRLSVIDPEVTFNYSIGESMEFAEKKRMAHKDFREFIRSDNFLTTGFGDVYAFMEPRVEEKSI